MFDKVEWNKACETFDKKYSHTYHDFEAAEKELQPFFTNVSWPEFEQMGKGIDIVSNINNMRRS